MEEPVRSEITKKERDCLIEYLQWAIKQLEEEVSVDQTPEEITQITREIAENVPETGIGEATENFPKARETDLDKNTEKGLIEQITQENEVPTAADAQNSVENENPSETTQDMMTEEENVPDNDTTDQISSENNEGGQKEIDKTGIQKNDESSKQATKDRLMKDAETQTPQEIDKTQPKTKFDDVTDIKELLEEMAKRIQLNPVEAREITTPMTDNLTKSLRDDGDEFGDFAYVETLKLLMKDIEIPTKTCYLFPIQNTQKGDSGENLDQNVFTEEGEEDRKKTTEMDGNLITPESVQKTPSEVAEHENVEDAAEIAQQNEDAKNIEEQTSVKNLIEPTFVEADEGTTSGGGNPNTAEDAKQPEPEVHESEPPNVIYRAPLELLEYIVENFYP